MFGAYYEGEALRQKRLNQLVRDIEPGMPREQLVPGAIVTISTNKATGDRSYTDSIWQVEGSSGNSILLSLVSGHCFGDRKQRLVQFHEHEFYAAEHLAEKTPKEEGSA